MSNDEKLLRLLTFSARQLVAGARKRSITRLNDSLDDLEFIVRGFSPAVAKKAATTTTPATAASPQIINILMLDEEKFGEYIAGEAHKFFLAAMVSLERSRQPQQHNLAWQVVEHYYAAYYAVHYLMRVCGYSVTNLDDKAIRKIKASSIVATTSMKGGLCTLEFSQECSDISIIKNEKGGGSHKDAWSIWLRILDDLINECKKDTDEYSSLEVDLISHKNFISNNGHKFNPSDIRAEINYQFKGDAWCFEDKTNERVGIINRDINKDTFDVTFATDKVINLINNNKLIIMLARLFFEYSSSEYKQGICRSLQHRYKHKIGILSSRP